MFHQEPTPISLNKNVTLILPRGTPVPQTEILYQTKTRVTANTVANQLTCEYKRLAGTTTFCCRMSKNNRNIEKVWGAAVPRVVFLG